MIAGSMSSILNLVPLSERLADEPNSGKPASRLSRVSSAWKRPASSMATVPSRVLAASKLRQHRVVEPARRNAAERQIVVLDDCVHDVAAARRAALNASLNRQIGDPRVAFGGTALLGREDAAQRRRRTAERGVADRMRHDRRAAPAQGRERQPGVAGNIEEAHGLRSV